jgi:hypothetical protein
MKFSVKQTGAVGLTFALVLAVFCSNVADLHASELPISAALRAQPLNVGFDTDIWSDIDDMLALAMLHALHDRDGSKSGRSHDQHR